MVVMAHLATTQAAEIALGPDWCGLLKAELKRGNKTYADLGGMLKRIGVKEDEHNLRNKVARRKFTASFFLQCVSAIGVKNISLD
jgi:hypothetical protein